METKRLVIRRFEPGDSDALSALVLDKMRSADSIYDEQFPTDPDGMRSVLDYFVGSPEFFALTRKAEGDLIGFVSLNYVDADMRNLGYCVLTACRGQGYASEAVAAMMRYAKEELHTKKLVAGTAKANEPSVRLLSKFGFRVTGERKASFAKDADGAPILFDAFSFERAL